MTSSNSMLDSLSRLLRAPRQFRLTIPSMKDSGAGMDAVTYRPGVTSELPRRGTVSFLRAYRQAPLLRAVVAKIADRVSTVEVYVEANVGNGWQYLPAHSAARVWRNGGPGLSGFALRKIAAAYVETVGEAFIGIGRDNRDLPNRLYVIPPHWIHRTPRPNSPTYEIRPTNGAAPLPVEERDLIWIKDPDLEDPYGRGSGIAQALEDELNVDEYAARHAANFFSNHARPDLIVQGKDEPLTREEAKRFEETWLDKFRGVKKRGLPLFSARRVEVTPVGQGFGDLGIEKVRNFERDLIISVYGMPPEVMGVLQNSNRATIESADFLLAKNVVEPRMTLVVEALNSQLAPQFGETIRFAYESPVKEDKDRRIKAATDNKEILTIDERRELLFDLGPLPNGQGQKRIVPFNVSEIAVAEAEAGGGASVRAVEGAQEKAALAAPVAKSFGDDDVSRITQAAVAAAIADAVGPIIVEVIEEFGSRAAAEYGFLIDFDLADPRVEEFISEFGGERIRDLVNETSRQRLAESLREGIASGENSEKLAQRIRNVFDGRRDNAATIARTEIVRASNFATQASFDQGGVEMKEWLATFDGNVRDQHSELDGTIIDRDAEFQSEGYGARYPGDFGAAHLDINCRCSILPVFPELGEGSSARRVAEAEEKRIQIFEAVDRSRVTFEERFVEAIVRAFDSQEEAVLAELYRAPTGTS